MTLPPPDPRLRAGDGDRDAVAEQLREAHAEGRLTIEELEDRLGKTYAARTFADLAPLTADLPPRPFGGSVRVQPRSLAPPRANVPARRETQSGSWVDSGLRASWYAWATAVSVTVVIWLIISRDRWRLDDFWPAWVAGPWGAVLLVATLSRRAEQPRRRLQPGSRR